MHQFDRIKKIHLVTNTASLAIFIVFVVSIIKLTLLYFSLCKWVLVMERKYFYRDWMVVVLQTWFIKGDNTGFIVFINLDLDHSFSSHVLNESTPLDFYSCNYLFCGIFACTSCRIHLWICQISYSSGLLFIFSTKMIYS